MNNNKPLIYVAACAVIVGIAYGMHSPIVPVFAREELRANFSEVGVIGLANYLPYMVVPLFVGVLLDRTNKAYLLILGVSLNIFAIFMLSSVNAVSEAVLFRGLSGIAHSFFWPSSETIISTTALPDKRVKWIAIFTAAWVGGFMTGPLIGKIILDNFLTYHVLFEISAAVIAIALVPSLLLQRHSRPILTSKKELDSRYASEHKNSDDEWTDNKRIEEETKFNAKSAHRRRQIRLSNIDLSEIKHEVTSMPTVSAVVLYYAITFGVLIAIYPAYMKAASVSDQNIELLFFVFGLSRFATLPFINRIAHAGRYALVFAVVTMAASMAISFASNNSILLFATALTLAGVATSVFYPVTFNFIVKNAPLEKMGTKLGIYEALFGAGWTVGPIAVGVSSDAFGSSSPYAAFSVVGAVLACTIMLIKGHKVRGPSS